MGEVNTNSLKLVDDLFVNRNVLCWNGHDELEYWQSSNNVNKAYQHNWSYSSEECCCTHLKQNKIH